MEPIKPHCRHAFTLVELLAVMAIIVVIMALVVPATHSMLDEYRLTGAGNRLAALIERARVHATTTQHVAVLRFYAGLEEKNPADGYAVVSLMEIAPGGSGSATAIARAFRIEAPVILSATHSTAFASGGMVSGTGSVLNVTGVPYKEFYLFPDGSASLEAASPNPYFTLHARRDGTALHNPFVVSLDPVTTRVTLFRRQ